MQLGLLYRTIYLTSSTSDFLKQMYFASKMPPSNICIRSVPLLNKKAESGVYENIFIILHKDDSH